MKRKEKTLSNPTHFSNRCEILAELWMNYRDDEQFADFIEYNDLGLPLAYMLANAITKGTDTSEAMVNETWELFLHGLGIVEDTGFETLDEMFDETDIDEDTDLGD
jgi:hypothetical protein